MRWALPLTFLVFMTQAVHSAEPIKLRASNYLPPMSVAVSKVMEPWIAEVERLTDGRVRVQRYWGGSLGRGPHRQYKLAEEGVTDITFLFLAMDAGRFSDAEVLEIPTVFNSSEELSTIGWQLFEEGLFRGFEDIKVLGFFSTAPGRLFTQTPVNTLEDYKGLKLRASGRLQAAYVSGIGATPEIIDAATATDGLRRGTIDGLIQGWSGMAIFRQAEVTDYFLDVPVGAVPFAMVMNKDRWESLSTDVQEAIMSVSGMHLSKFAGQAYDDAADGFRKRFVDGGDLSPTPLSDQTRQHIQTMIDQVRQDWVAEDPHRAKLLKRVEELKRVRDDE